MLSCRRVSEIVASGTEDLGLARRMELRMHLFMCVHCRRYARQMTAIRGAIRRLVDRLPSPSPQEIAELETAILARAFRDRRTDQEI